MSHFGLKAPDVYGETLRMHGTHKVVSAVVDGDRVEIVRQYPSNTVYANGLPAPDRVVKEVYEIQDFGSKIELIEEIEGVHTPAHFVQETIAFPK
jgi:gamma-glutamylcyclotransferase (GGCT)/AIG2-like uncharacterized protein YtfP